MITTLLHFFLACSTSQDPLDQSKIDWELYEPDFILEAPIGQELTWSAPDSIADELQVALDDWNRHLSCGLEITRVESGGDLQFQCSKPQRIIFYHSDVMTWEREGLVSIGERYCENLNKHVALHAWGHQLGFAETFRWYPNMTEPMVVDLAVRGRRPHDWGAIETDGLRIWAHRQGAPGCGNNELPWSWQSDPELYRTHPMTKEAKAMFEGA